MQFTADYVQGFNENKETEDPTKGFGITPLGVMKTITTGIGQ